MSAGMDRIIEKKNYPCEPLIMMTVLKITQIQYEYSLNNLETLAKTFSHHSVW